MKRALFSMALGVAAACIMVMPAAAQGRGAAASAGHANGAAGSMGSMGSMGADHSMGAAANAGGNSANAGGTASGPRTPGDLLTQNTKLSSNLSSLLPAGTDLQTAASGYKNLGQFVAAVHVSHNLGIPFDQLKCTELATTDACPNMTVPAKGSKLGGAIQTLKPSTTSSDTKAAVKQANKQASHDISSTS